MPYAFTVFKGARKMELGFHKTFSILFQVSLRQSVRLSPDGLLIKTGSRSIITTSLTSSSAASLTCLLLLPPHFHYLWPIPSSLPFSPVVTWHWYFLYWWVDVLINVLTPFSKSVNNHLPKRENIFCINFIIKNILRNLVAISYPAIHLTLGGWGRGGGERTIPPWDVGQERRAK